MTGAARDHEAGLPIERYAEATAHLAHFRKADPAEVIDRLGIEADDFEAAQKSWTSAIGDELERRETTLALRLGAVFAPTRQRLAEVQPALESLGPRASERVKPVAPVETIEDMEKLVAVEPASAPIPPPPSAPRKEPEEQPSVSFPPAAYPAAIVPPPIMIAPPPLFATPAPPVVQAAWSEPAMASPPRREDLARGGVRHVVNLGATAIVHDAPTATPALPFGRGAPPGPPKPAAPASLVPEGMRRFISLTGTTGPVDAPVGLALPFAGSPAPAGPPPPFAGGPAPAPTADPPEALMSLEGYTRLHVELAREPANRRAIAQRHGIDEPRLAQLDAYWGPRIKADAGLRARWDSTYAAHRARLGPPAGPSR